MATIEAMPKYEDYKDSGVEWVGGIPEHWELKKLKYLLSEPLKYGANESGIEYEKELPRYIRITDFSDEGTLNQDSKLSLTWEIGKDYLLKDGDILLARSGATVGKSYQFKISMSKEKFYSFAGYLIKASSNQNEIQSDYLNLYFNSDKFYAWKSLIFNKATIENIGADKYSTLPIIVPPLKEQTAITNFLDKKTTQIDEAIAIKEKQIVLLKERKQIIIQKAVTQGLNPNVPMKDSGVDWIGEIPEHWEVKRAKYLFKEIDERSAKGNEELLSVSHLTGVTPRSEKSVTMIAEDYTGSKTCQENDLIMNIMWAWMGALGVSDRAGIVSSAYGIYRQKPLHTFNPIYLEWLLKTTGYIEHYNKVSTGLHSSRLRFYSHMFFDMEIGLPEREEQNQIVEYVAKQSLKIDNASELNDIQIKKLKEYKTTLINSAVTGKIKIQGHDYDA